MKKYVLLLLIFVVSGCTTFREKNVKFLEDIPSTTSPHSIALYYTSCRKGSFDFAIQSDCLGGDISKHLTRQLQKTNLFEEIEPNLKNADYNLYVETFTQEQGSYVAAIITGFSLYTIPSWVREEVVISAKIENTKTGKSKKFAFNDSMLMIQWILLAPLSPFMTPFAQEHYMVRDLSRRIALEVYTAMQELD